MFDNDCWLSITIVKIEKHTSRRRTTTMPTLQIFITILLCEGLCMHALMGSFLFLIWIDCNFILFYQYFVFFLSF